MKCLHIQDFSDNPSTPIRDEITLNSSSLATPHHEQNHCTLIVPVKLDENDVRYLFSVTFRLNSITQSVRKSDIPLEEFWDEVSSHQPNTSVVIK